MKIKVTPTVLILFFFAMQTSFASETEAENVKDKTQPCPNYLQFRQIGCENAKKELKAAMQDWMSQYLRDRAVEDYRQALELFDHQEKKEDDNAN